jgi:hypothetical protein
LKVLPDNGYPATVVHEAGHMPRAKAMAAMERVERMFTGHITANWPLAGKSIING